MEELNVQFAAPWFKARPTVDKPRPLPGSEDGQKNDNQTDNAITFDPNFELTINHLQELCNNFDTFGALRISRVLIALTGLSRYAQQRRDFRVQGSLTTLSAGLSSKILYLGICESTEYVQAKPCTCGSTGVWSEKEIARMFPVRSRSWLVERSLVLEPTNVADSSFKICKLFQNFACTILNK